MDLDYPKTLLALRSLAALGIVTDADAVLRRVGIYRDLCSTWNLAAKLMSRGDLEERFDDHVADSLALAHRVKQALANGLNYVDIGSGGGFPAIALGAAFIVESAILIERSAAKADFLRMAIRRLELDVFRVIEQSFPSGFKREGPTLFTARATENPKAIDTSIAERLEVGDEYLAQREPRIGDAFPHLTSTLIEDEFAKTGLRRGVLYKVSFPVPRGT